MKNIQVPSYLLLAACSAAVLSACGAGMPGSMPSANIPPPAVVGQSTVTGTVTGFGSVIVDGVRVNNSRVAAGKEHDDGTVEAAELKLGQHVEIEHDGQLVATKVRISAEVEGAVSAVDPATGTLTILGQTVTINADPALGPVTVFEGYTALAGIQVGDKVEIHGVIKTDAAGRATLQATRIEKKTVADTADRVNGLVAELSTTAHTFKLGNLLIDYSSARLMPEGAVLANGSAVRVVVPLGAAAGSTPVKAIAVKVRTHKDESGTRDSELGGPISALDAATKTLTINGVKIDASAATFRLAGQAFADLKLNAYVVIKGSYDADGTLKAATIVLRGEDHERGGQVELHGSVADFVSVASFTVRGVQVDATGVVLDAASCGSAVLANDLQVEVTGALSATGQVKAMAISCEQAGDGIAVVTRQGVAGNVDAGARTFSLVNDKETIPVKWGELTLFRNVDAATLAGKKLEVEGITVDGVLHALKVVYEQD